MLPKFLLAALLSTSAIAVQPEIQRRQDGGGAQFTAAASQLVSVYVPQSVFAVIGPSVQAAASSASVTYSDVQSLIYSALLATSVPDWFNSAIPSAYSQQFQSLEDDISELRAGVTALQATATAGFPVVIAITTTDATGGTFTTSVTTTEAPGGTVTGTITTGALSTITATEVAPVTSTYTDSAGSTITSVIGGVAVSGTTIYTDSAGSTITSVFGVGVSGASSAGSVAISGASSVASEGVSGASSVASEGVSGASSVGSVAISGASSVGSVAISGASSVVSAASSVFAPPRSTAPPNAAAMPTVALSGAAAGALGLIGLMIAL